MVVKFLLNEQGMVLSLFLSRDTMLKERLYATVATVKSSTCLSVRDVDVCFTHRLKYFENNLRPSLRHLLTLNPSWAIWCNGSTTKISVE